MRLSCWLAALLAVSVAAAQSLPLGAADIATVETTADGAVHGSKFDGTAETLTTSGPRDAVIFRFRTSLIENWKVSKAVVAFHIPKGAAAPAQVIVSAIQADWNQGAVIPPRIEEGIPATTRSLKDDWFTIELPAAVANQLASGQSASIAISVAEGAGLAVHSHRTGQFMPYLLVRGVRPPAEKSVTRVIK